VVQPIHSISLARTDMVGKAEHGLDDRNIAGADVVPATASAKVCWAGTM
jgi:hypothetical protein